MRAAYFKDLGPRYDADFQHAPVQGVEKLVVAPVLRPQVIRLRPTPPSPGFFRRWTRWLTWISR
jgi:hypothetical protein